MARMASGTNNAYGCLIIKRPQHILTQKGWRIAGICFLAAAGAMAFFGGAIAGPGAGLRMLILYWGVFSLCLLLALYMALLDIKYIRLQYRLEAREVFEQTLASPEFRAALKEAERKQTQDQDTPG